MTTVPDAFDSMAWGPAPESAARAAAWLDGHERRFGHWIGGRWAAPAMGEWFPSINPATRETLAQIAQGSPEDVARAVRAARTAQPGWWALGGHGRARHLYALARHLQKQSRLFAVLETLDNGKPIRESRDIDVPLVARHFAHHAGWAELMETALPGYQPVGVVGQIIPWNFPLLMLAWKIAPALAMGNTVVLKPAEFTSLTALGFAELAAAAGLPPGVVNIVTGDGRTGQALVAHDDVDKIAFTGSTEVGRAIRVATAGSGKALTLELGGKSPFIVFDDADLDSVVEGVVDAIWFNQGQVCCAGSRLLVQEPVAERLYDKLRARMETLRVGDPLDKAIDIGAIVAPVQLHPPALFTDVAPAAAADEEIVGPVVVAMTFRTPAEAVELANNTRDGLAASIWTENINTALDIAPAVKAGTVWVNCTNVFDAAAGFGGYRESGFGREGGIEGLWGYVRRASPGDPHGTAPPAPRTEAPDRPAAPPIDRTYKLYIGGTQVRPDSGYSRPVQDAAGRQVAEVGLGNRKDIRNAVEAARGAQPGWWRATAHLRAQILFSLGENLAVRAAELAARIAELTGAAAADAGREVDVAIRHCFTWAAWADKYDGRVHATPLRNVTIAMNEPIGVIGIVAPEFPSLAGFLATVLPPVAMGNAVVAVPSERCPLPALDCHQMLDTSDVPAGVVNIVTGPRDELAGVLAAHDDVDGIWYLGGADGAARVESLSAGNLKRTWTDTAPRDWLEEPLGPGALELLRESTQVKNIWVPYGA